MIRYKKLMQMRDDADFLDSEAAFTSIVFAIFACAARVLSDARLSSDTSDDGGMGMVYYER